MTLPPERAVELAKSPKANKWKMIKAKVEFIINYIFVFRECMFVLTL